MSLTVVYSSDDHYAQHAGVSLISLFENNKQFEHIQVFLIENHISEHNKNTLRLTCEKYKRSIEFIELGGLCEKLRLNIGDAISINSYARLFLSSMLQHIDKVIYLDCDTIINQSLRDLWEIDIKDYDLAGVCDTASDDTKQRVNMKPNDPYINAGVLLINLKRWRQRSVERKFMQFIDSFQGEVFHHDQGTINGVLHPNMLLLPPRYNAMTTFFTMTREQILQYYGMNHYYSELELKQAVSDPVIVHFTPAFVNRPWVKGSKHPLASLYAKYCDMSPWQGGGLSKDGRGHGEKMIAFMYNNLPFRIANGISKFISK